MSTSHSDPETLLTVAQAAQRLHVSIAMVYRLVTDREMEHIRVGIGRGTIRIPASEIDRYLRQNEK
jgi:excisionase family DNA binding protein